MSHDPPSNGGPPNESADSKQGLSGAKRRRRLPTDLRLQLSTRVSVNTGDHPDGETEGAPVAGGTFAARPAFTELKLEDTFQTKIPPEEQKSHIKQIMDERKIGQKKKSKVQIASDLFHKTFPFVRMVARYNIKEYGAFDLISGISVGLFLIPQSMAYALLANVRPQYGFYSAILCMIIYFIFGAAPHVNMTNQGAVSLLVGEAVRAGVEQVYPGGAGLCPTTTTAVNSSGLNSTISAIYSTTTVSVTTSLSSSNFTASSKPCISRDEANIEVSITIAMIVGALLMLGSFLQLGFLTIYLSDPINKAFTCGAAMQIVVGQVGNMLGAPIPSFSGNGKFFLFLIEAFKQIALSKVNVPTILVFFGSFLILFVFKVVNEKYIKKIRVPIPIDIIVLVVTLLLSRFLYWNDTLKISVIGDIKKGFEAPRVPPVEHFTSGSGIIVNGVVLGIITYSMSISLAKTFGLRNGYEVDPNQEMFAYGISNFGACWFGIFVSAAAIACSSLHESLKGKTLMYSVYATVITFVAIMIVAPEFAATPKCVLSAIIIVNLKGIINQVDQLPTMWRTNRYDFFIFVVTLAAVLCLDLPIGLLIGVGFSLATVIFRTQSPKAYLLGRLPNTDIYRNIKKNKTAEQIPGIRIFKFDGAMYFASADSYRVRLYRQVGMHPKKVLTQAKAKARKEGRPSGALDLRTDIIRSDGIKRILDAVREDNDRLTADGQYVAPETPIEGTPYNGFGSFGTLSNEAEDVPSVVNVFCIILDMSACSFTDSVGIRLLSQIVDEFSKIGIDIYLSGVNSVVRSQLKNGRFYSKRSEDGLFVTVHDAVLHALSSLYLELLEDERQRYLAEHPEENSGSEALENQNGTFEPLDKPKLAGTDLARERRRRIRQESLRAGNNSSNDAAAVVDVSNGHAQRISSLPVLGDSQVAATPSVKSVPVAFVTDGSAGFGLPQYVYSSPEMTPRAGGQPARGGVDNHAYEGDTRF